MSTKTINLTEDVYHYLQSLSLHEPSVLTDLRAKTSELSVANMQISPEQGQFMALLVQLMGAKKTLDIGTFTGYSALVVALALGADGHVFACDVNTEWTNIAKQYWEKAGVADNIILKIAPALQTLQELIDCDQANTFDFAFIDADKRNYQAYYEKSLTLLRPGGLIAIDNVLWGGEVVNEFNQSNEVVNIRAFNQFVYQDHRVTMSLLPIGDGLTLARKNECA